jgi:hypothetical protein
MQDSTSPFFPSGRGAIYRIPRRDVIEDRGFTINAITGFDKSNPCENRDGWIKRFDVGVRFIASREEMLSKIVDLQ